MSGLEILPALYRAQSRGILPLTSTCNARCLFCSNRFNPPGVQTYSIPPRDPDEVAATLDWLAAAPKIVIGESVTRINEGEPFTHPRIGQILALVRHRFPARPIEITTNGGAVEAEDIELLAGLRPVKITLSLNSADPAIRGRLMGESNPLAALRTLERLAGRDIPFDGSIVALPHLFGWADLERTVRTLDRHGARTIRLFLPGFSRLAPAAIQPPEGLRRDLERFADTLAEELSAPLTVEPPLLADLVPVVAGVIRNSPAERAGLRRGDIIEDVNGRRPRSRVEAFRIIARAAHPRLTCRRGEDCGQLGMAKDGNASSGLVFHYDIDPDSAEGLALAIRRHRARRPFALTSRLAYQVVRRAVAELVPGALEVRAVENRFFGGSIMAGGLLVVEDFLAPVVAGELRAAGADLVAVPALAFDDRGCDLVGRSYLELAEAWGCPVELV